MRLIPLVFLAACPGGSMDSDKSDGTDLDSADADTDTDTDADCSAVITGLSPDDGATDVAVNTPIVATFSDPVTSADFEVEDGPDGTVTLAEDGSSAVFTLDDPLDNATEYTATASACGDERSVSFTTIAAAEASEIDGRTYALFMFDSDITWVKPSYGDLLADSLGADHILAMVESAGSDIDLLGAAGFVRKGEVEQYPCAYAFDFEPTSFENNPAFSVGPLDAALAASGVTFTVYDLVVSGTFVDKGTAIEETHATGVLETAPISEATGVDVCALAESMGEPCVECPDGEDGCLELEVIDALTPWVEGLEVDPDQDPETDRYCE